MAASDIAERTAESLFPLTYYFLAGAFVIAPLGCRKSSARRHPAVVDRGKTCPFSFPHGKFSRSSEAFYEPSHEPRATCLLRPLGAPVIYEN